MVKTQIEIEIPDEHEIVEVRYGSSVMVLDKLDSSLEKKSIIYVHTRPAKPFIINGVPSEWPEWLLCDWITKDEDGELYLHKSEPQREYDGWFCTDGIFYLDKSLIGIDIPGPWEQSKRKNPKK